MAAVGSYLQAKHQSGKWLLRIDDLDPPREMPNAAKNIQRTLEKLGLYWDDEPIYQSRQHEYYAKGLAELKQKNLLYPCHCSRKTIKTNGATSGKIGWIYPGTCRKKMDAVWSGGSIRLRVENNEIHFHDGLQGQIKQQLAIDTGDVCLKRAEGLYAYHIAVVIDDNRQGITEIVRGYDLLQCTPIQIFLQHCLNYKTPRYIHLPIIVDQNNEKLSKQTGASSIENTSPARVLFQVLTLLKQSPPTSLANSNKHEILNWAIHHWDLQACSGQRIPCTFKI